MKVLLYLLLALFMGCSTLHLEPASKTNRPSLSYVFKDTQGCKDKVSFTGTKIKLHWCFW